LIEEVKKESQKEYVSPSELAVDYAGMGDGDYTFDWLEKAYGERSGCMEYIKNEDFLVPFHLIRATSTCSNAWVCRSDLLNHRGTSGIPEAVP